MTNDLSQNELISCKLSKALVKSLGENFFIDPYVID